MPHTRANCAGCSTEFAFLVFVFLKKLFSFLPAISLFLLLVKLDVSLLVFGYSKRLCHVVAFGKVTTLSVLPPHRLMPSWGGGGCAIRVKELLQTFGGGVLQFLFFVEYI